MNIRHQIRTLLATACCLTVVSTAAAADGYRDTSVAMTVEEDLDLSQYLGTWYEIARFPNNFEMGCEGVTAQYSARDDDRIDVVNRCYREGLNGPLDTAEGVARVAGQGRLEVNFVSWLRLLPFTWGDYWVLDVDAEYEVAVVGTPNGKQGWILARAPEISADKLTEAKSVLRKNGYDIGALEMVPQN
ncbi:lipocalin family protein [Tritonibacter scottomollicae]|uniref:Outer membrane lipoprotein Blc n=1 Tax=Tritonibacter scottomollicae TaxID=483013 RepID=A0ABZ0HMK1_TRISK|nr:lipocalin family protein [Tritonibacter scottomollicae]WOI35131.1 lipocalin family protein [Tritonibacter scottomollicae]